MAVNVKYKRNLEKEQIDIATFSLNDEKSLVLSVIDNYDIDDGETILSQSLKVLIRDSRYGEEELFVELDLRDGKDLIKIMQKMMRQIGDFRPK
jgi:hypothetical protein